MIKPTYLWALCKTCKDSKWIGDICRHLGGQDDVSLDFGQKQVADMIKMDSEWMDERINWNREAARMRKVRERERKAAELAALKKAAGIDGEPSPEPIKDDVTSQCHAKSRPCHAIHPSVHPSIHPLEDERVCVSPARACEGDEPPTLEEVLKVAADGAHRSGGEAIPESFAREWYALMQTADWFDTKGAKIGANAWRGKLGYAWRDEKKRRAKEGGDKADDEGRREREAEAEKRIVEDLRRKGLM